MPFGELEALQSVQDSPRRERRNGCFGERLKVSENQRAEHVSINIFDLIEQLCADFRRQWKAGQRPRIEVYLGKVPDEARMVLFRNMLQAEIRSRRQVGESPNSDEYVNRFPAFKRVIRQAFDEPSMMSIDELAILSGESDAAVTATIDMPAANRIGDYELVRELGRGGFGVVYEARHIERGNRVALKTLPTGVDGQEINAERLHRFRREFRSLAEFNHPNLVGMQTLEVHGSQWYFTMDLIDGEDFLSWVRAGDRLDEQRLRHALQQLAGGIIALHQRGVVHRDLKPSNVLVEPDGRVVILDFGLVAELQKATDQTASLRTAAFAGTPRYAAPEQLFGERTEASDFYALGTMLYEAMTGEVPFRGNQVELLRQKQEQDAPSLSARDDIPDDLANLVDDLLQRDPKQRMRTDSLIETVGLDWGSTTHGTSAAELIDEESTEPWDESDQILIGREQQLAQLEEARQEFLMTGQPVTVFISGLSGEGKSSLAEKFLARFRHNHEMLVLAGRCYDRESVPFKAIDSIIDPLVGYLRSRRGKWLRGYLPEDTAFLAQLFPLLRRVDAISAFPSIDLSRMEPEKIRARGFWALRELLRTIASRTPIAILIDDLQWADVDSARAWVEMLTPPDPAPLLFLGSYRSDEAAESSFLQTWKELTAQERRRVVSREVSVEPLTRAQCMELASIRTGADADFIARQADELFSDTGGNPYFLEQLIEGFDPETGSFQHVPLADIIASRLRRLTGHASSLLNVIAVSGQPLPIDEAIDVAGGKTADIATITHMRSERLVRLIGDRSQTMVDTYHDKIRETVIDGMPEEERRQLHLKLGEMIEIQEGLNATHVLDQLSSFSMPGEGVAYSSRVGDLAHHFSEANDPRAFTYQTLAGEMALQAYAVEDALVAYRVAERLLPVNASDALRFRLNYASGSVFQWNKDRERALESYGQAVKFAGNPFDRSRAYIGLGTVHQQVAEFDLAISFFDKGLEQIGSGLAKTRIGGLCSTLATSLRIFFIPAGWMAASNTDERQRHLIAHDVLNRGRYSQMEKDFFRTCDGSFRGYLAAIRTGDTQYVQFGYALSGEGLCTIGLRWPGLLMIQRSARSGEAQKDPARIGMLHLSLAQANYWGGKPEESLNSYREAIKSLLRCGDYYHVLVATHMLRHAQAYLAPATTELRSAESVVELAADIGNQQQLCWGKYDVASAQARNGQLSVALKRMAEANALLTGERFQMTEAIRGSTDAYVRLQCSDYATARKLASTAWETAISSFVLIDVTVFCLPLLIESLAGPKWRDSKPTQDDAKFLRKMQRRAAFLYPTLPNHQPHLHRVFGRARYCLGRHRKAIRHFQKAAKLAAQKGMDYQRAKCLLDLAAVKEDRRDENRREAIRLLKKMESVIPRAESWLLGDQYDEAVVAPEFDLKAWEDEHGPVSPQIQMDSD